MIATKLRNWRDRAIVRFATYGMFRLLRAKPIFLRWPDGRREHGAVSKIETEKSPEGWRFYAVIVVPVARPGPKGKLDFDLDTYRIEWPLIKWNKTGGFYTVEMEP